MFLHFYHHSTVFNSKKTQQHKMKIFVFALCIILVLFCSNYGSSSNEFTRFNYCKDGSGICNSSPASRSRSKRSDINDSSTDSNSAAILREENSHTTTADLSGREEYGVAPLRREKRGVAIVGAVVSAVVNIAGMIMNRKHAEEAAKRYRQTMKFKLEQLCDAICVTEWSSWTVCTKQCGNGKRERSRQHQMPGRCASLENFKCRHSVKQQEWCNLGCPNGGSPSQHGCQCRPGYHGNCCQFDTVCEYPGRPRQGEISGVFPANFRSVAMFSCAAGYELEGSDAVVCQADGAWSDTPPRCNVIKCTLDPPQEHVRILNSASEYYWGEEVHYMCEEGYVLRGPETRKCTQRHGITRWTGFNPSCEVVKCDRPVAPLNGEMNGTNHRYRDHVSFKCDQGFKLIGSQSMTCMETGKWAGRPPTCDVIECDPPLVPRHGSLRSRSLGFASVVVFSCDDGYVLEGSAVLQCGATGDWNGTEPFCKAAICGNPGVPIHGYKDGSTYYYPHSVKFGCYSGYILHGSDVLKCQRNGTWASTVPECIACAVGTYMDIDRNPGECTPCPANSHTLTEGSSQRQHCLCDPGYRGPPGGPCNEILCPPLSPPIAGSITCTGNKVNDMCNTSCDSGHVVRSGTNQHTCLDDGMWSGREVTCERCPINTFQSEERICVPCPRHSHTEGEGHLKVGCTCDQGYTGPPGGPCIDINECANNSGRGPCDDLCENLDGGYKCGCSVPGHKISPKDRHVCIVEKQCQNLTEVDAPLNGGLVCYWYRQHNSQHCGIKCNQGYEYPDRVNNYEYCGQNTGYIWSFRQEDSEAVLEPCIEEFFENFRLEADSTYFVTACQDLTDEDKEKVKIEFAKVLDENGICKKSETKSCDIKDMAIICGRRTKRSLLGELSSVDLQFKLEAVRFEDQPKKCDQVCEMLKIPQKSCSQKLCIESYKRFLKASLLYAKRTLTDAFASRTDRMRFNVNHRTFQPDEIRTSDVIVNCDAGMVGRSGMCVPCASGTFYDSINKMCEPCPHGTYTPLEGSTECYECPTGTTTYTNGSAACQECKAGWHGEMCRQQCSCTHGRCNPLTGECLCDSGWTGVRCETDEPGCADHTCSDDSRCVDVRAPGTGYRCVAPSSEHRKPRLIQNLRHDIL